MKFELTTEKPISAKLLAAALKQAAVGVELCGMQSGAVRDKKGEVIGTWTLTK